MALAFPQLLMRFNWLQTFQGTVIKANPTSQQSRWVSVWGAGGGIRWGWALRDTSRSNFHLWFSFRHCWSHPWANKASCHLICAKHFNDSIEVWRLFRDYKALLLISFCHLKNTVVFQGYMPRSRITGSYGSFCVSFFKNPPYCS